MTGRLLEGRRALVTGGGQGVGQGIARALAAARADVCVVQRTAALAEQEATYLRETHGVRAFAHAIDLRHGDQVDAMVAAVAARFGGLDILVNNAGASQPRRLENHSEQDMTAICLSAFRTMQAAFPIMKAQRYGRIINLGSLNGVNAHRHTVSYNVAKEAVRALTRTAAVEWGCHGITANILCPSAISPAARQYFADNPDMLATVTAQKPLGRIGDTTDDIGPVAVFLASDQSRYVTGCPLFADGGSHINGVTWRPAVDD